MPGKAADTKKIKAQGPECDVGPLSIRQLQQDHKTQTKGGTRPRRMENISPDFAFYYCCHYRQMSAVPANVSTLLSSKNEARKARKIKT